VIAAASERPASGAENTAAPAPPWPQRRGAALTLLAGLSIILASEILLWIDVTTRQAAPGATPAAPPVSPPPNTFGALARWVAQDMTSLCWAGYLLALDGAMALWARRRCDSQLCPIRTRPNRFVAACLISVLSWCYFDWINFAFMDAWRYQGLPPNPVQRYVGYFVAFAAITPGMLLAAHVYQHWGLRSVRSGPLRLPLAAQIAMVLLGASFAIYPFFARDPIANLTLWLGMLLLLDPVNHWLGGPSVIGDWQAGRWGRTLALMAGGATSGLLWEFWNYWAVAKWTYRLPFLGGFENYRYFEMPWLGFLGFLPFAIESWAMFNTALILMHRLGLWIAEPLPNDDCVL
jgi:hypothetical protein